MKLFAILPPRIQPDREEAPFDRSFTQNGEIAAEFFRSEGGFLLRFPGMADFKIEAGTLAVSCYPVPGLSESAANTLFHNSISPLLVNYSGGLNLHASGVTISGKAVGFVGISGSGKTTLAGAFASSGHPLLAEDILVLEKAGDDIVALPSRSILRLFSDSSLFLFGDQEAKGDRNCKVEIEVSDKLPIANVKSPLAAIFLLGPGKQASTTIERLKPSAALARLICHAFSLDVEDKKFMRSHFLRLGDLSEAVPCYLLDYPRDYDHLSEVIDKVRQIIYEGGANNEVN
jgi:hypothetical protein